MVASDDFCVPGLFFFVNLPAGCIKNDMNMLRRFTVMCKEEGICLRVNASRQERGTFPNRPGFSIKWKYEHGK